MSRRPIHLLVEDIWEAIEKVNRYTEGMTGQSFEADERTADAVARNLEIVGEAASRLPDEFKQEHPEIEWAKVAGLRHRIVHEYFGVDLKIIWRILKKDLPELGKILQRIREELKR